MKSFKLFVFKLILILYLFANYVNCHPAPSLILCHGLQLNLKYYYDYSTLMMLNNNDHSGKEPVGFKFESTFVVQNVWEDKSNFLLKIEFDPKSSGHFLDRKGLVRSKLNLASNELNYPLYALIHDDNESQTLQSFFFHNSESVTKVNLKKAIALLLRSKKSKKNENVFWSKTGQDVLQSYSSLEIKALNLEPILVPKIIDQWSSLSKVGRDHTIILESNGWQNVSLTSRLYNEAYSKLYLTYKLKMVKEKQVEKSELSTYLSIAEVIEALGEEFVEEKQMLRPEKKYCHNCKSLESLEKEYEEHMRAQEMASIPATIAYFKLLDRIRSGGPGVARDDIISLLKRLANSKDVLASLLDILSSSRSESAISASLEFLNLVENEDLDLSERFLITLAASSLTISRSSKTSDSSLEFILKELLKIVRTPNWKTEKLKWSTLLTLATVLQAYNNLQITNNLIVNDLNQETYKVLKTELNFCSESDCKVALLHALGSGGNLQLGYDVLESFALDAKAKKESVTALKSIQEGLKFLFNQCSESGQEVYFCIKNSLGKKGTKRLRNMAAEIIWEPKQETTSRIIATEIIVNYLSDDIITNSLLQDVQNFDNFEMTTMMWSRALKHKKSMFEASPVFKNWVIHSKLLNGSSAYYKKILGGTKTMNASYGITMEMLKQGKLLKESSFDFEINEENSKPQHVLSVSLLARGFQSFAGDDDGNEEAELTSAGMALKILGVQLRPYTLFSGKGELMKHVWSGTASEPITAFAGNLLIADHYDNHNLINGFVIEENFKGVLSLKLTGEIQISLWNRNSHSVVKTKGSLLIQGSQTILTSDQTPMISQQFTFGGSTSMNVVTDADFYRSPFKHCLQMHQPELIVRHNTRKYEQLDPEIIDRRIHRRTYYIPAKSFAFHNHNNEMCAILKTD